MKVSKALFSIIFISIFVPLISLAAGGVGLVQGVWLSNEQPIDSAKTTVYAVVRNQSDTKLAGIATLLVDGSPKQATEVQVPTKDIQKISIPYTFSKGVHTVSIQFTAHNGVDVNVAEVGKYRFTVLADTDKDGIPNITDTDDDNDGIPDTKDPHPLQPEPGTTIHIQGQSEKSVTNLFNKAKTALGVSASTNTASVQEYDKKPHGAVASTLHKVETARIQSAKAVQKYEDIHRKALQKITDNETKHAENVSGFKPSIKEQSDKRQQQIATVGAATLGWMLDKKFVFYAEVLVLILGVLHLLWIWIKAMLRPKEEYADAYDYEYEDTDEEEEK